MAAIALKGPLVGPYIPAAGAARAAAFAGLAVAGALILWASAKIAVPFWPVPMTLQTGAVALIGAAYGWRLGAATVLLYLAEGALGLPVFTGTPERGIGIAYMLGPTGGFLLGFVLMAAIVGWLVERGFDRSPFELFGAMLLADAVVFALGFYWLAALAVLPDGAVGIGFDKALTGGVLPFVFGDVVKLALAACLVSAGARLARR
jgi:biotin transport system substrate-specific component